MDQQPGKPQVPSLKDTTKQQKDTKPQQPLIPALKDAGKPQLKIKGLAGQTMSLLDRVKQFKKKDLAFITAGLGVLFMAPLAEHFMMAPENGGGTGFQEGFDRKDGVSAFGHGTSPYETGGGGLSPGSAIGAGSDIITPLNVRDPSALVMGPGASQPTPVSAPPPKEPAPSKSSSADWKDALANAAATGGKAAAKAASLPVPKIPLQGGLRGLGAVSGGGGGGSFTLAPINASNVPNKAAGSNSLSSAIAPTGFKGVGTRGPGSAEAGNLSNLKKAAADASNLMNRGGGAAALQDTANASSALPNAGAGTEGAGTGGADAAAKGSSQNGPDGAKSQGESLAFQLAKERAEKEMDLEFKKKEAGDLELEMFKIRNKAMEDIAGGFSKAAGDWLGCRIFGGNTCQESAPASGFFACTAAGGGNALVPATGVGKCGSSAGQSGGVTAQLCKCYAQPGGSAGVSLCGTDGTTVKFTGCTGANAPDSGGGVDCSKTPDDPSCKAKREPARKPGDPAPQEGTVKHPVEPKTPIGGTLAQKCDAVLNPKDASGNPISGDLGQVAGHTNIPESRYNAYIAATQKILTAGVNLRSGADSEYGGVQDARCKPAAKGSGTLASDISGRLNESQEGLQDESGGALVQLTKIPTLIKTKLSAVAESQKKDFTAVSDAFTSDAGMKAEAKLIDKGGDGAADAKTKWGQAFDKAVTAAGDKSGVVKEASDAYDYLMSLGYNKGKDANPDANLGDVLAKFKTVREQLKKIGGYAEGTEPKPFQCDLQSGTGCDGKSDLGQTGKLIADANKATKSPDSSGTKAVMVDDWKAFEAEVNAMLNASGPDSVVGSFNSEVGRYNKQAKALYDAKDNSKDNRYHVTDQLILVAADTVGGGTTSHGAQPVGKDNVQISMSYREYGVNTLVRLDALKSSVSPAGGAPEAPVNWTKATDAAFDGPGQGDNASCSAINNNAVKALSPNPASSVSDTVQQGNQAVLTALGGAPAPASKAK